MELRETETALLLVVPADNLTAHLQIGHVVGRKKAEGASHTKPTGGKTKNNHSQVPTPVTSTASLPLTVSEIILLFVVIR